MSANVQPYGVAWVHVPWEHEPKFLSIPDDGRPAFKLPAPRSPLIEWSPRPVGVPFRHFDQGRRLFYSPELGDAVVYLADDDRDRVLTMLRVAEASILFLAWVGSLGLRACHVCGNEHAAPDYGTGDGCAQW